MRKFSLKTHFQQISIWYTTNFRKISLLLLILVFFTLTASYVPFLNIFVNPTLGFGVFIFAWYMLFSPSTKLLVLLAIFGLLVSYFASIADLSVLYNSMSQFLFLFLIFIFFNYMKALK